MSEEDMSKGLRDEFDYSQICPGVRDLVRELRESHGMETTDSGDGTHFAEGMDGAMPWRHVYMSCERDEMIEAAEYLADEYPHGRVEATWSPGERAGLLLLPDGYTEAAKVRRATHRCKECGALWRLRGRGTPLSTGSWHLLSEAAGVCCDNAEMGDQIEALPTPPKDDYYDAQTIARRALAEGGKDE